MNSAPPAGSQCDTQAVEGSGSAMGSPVAVDRVKLAVPGASDRRAVITNGYCLLNTFANEPRTLFVDYLLPAVRGYRHLKFILILALFSVAVSGMAAPVPAPPEIKAKSWVLMDHNSGRILAQKNPDLRVEPASLTKIMTMYVVFSELVAGRLKLSDEVLISKKAWKMDGSRMFIVVDTKVPVELLIKGVIIQSGNDASVALAEHIAGDETAFSDLMNQYAARLGMTGTNFVNASGLPNVDHYTTARDMARMANALIRDFPQYYKYYSMKEFVYNGITQSNRNKLLWRDPSVDGMKTGYTASAGYCLVVSAQRKGMRLVSVLMGADSPRARVKLTQSLLTYGYRFYETRKIYAAGNAIKKFRVWKGDREDISVGLAEDLYITLPRGQFTELKPSMEIDANIIAPVAKGMTRGELLIRYQDKIISRRPLITLEKVATGNLWRQLSDSARMWFE